MTTWTPHGSNADYWRSDNPLIIAWYRFGDDDVGAVELKTGDDSGNRSYASGLLVDSSQRGLHLLYKGDADSFLRPTSGIAPWSSSGVIFGEQPGTTWVGGSHGDAVYQNIETYHENDSDTQPNKGVGPIAFGTETFPSGFTIMGWVKVPAAAVNTTLFRTIVSQTRTGDISNGAYFMIYRPSDRQIRAGVKFHNDASIPVLISTGDFSNNEEFFVAMQIHREYAVPGGWKNSVQGSGALRLFVGTVDTPLSEVATVEFTRSETRVETPNDLNPMTFGQDCITFITGSSDRHLPPDSILDEWVLVNDGYMPLDRIEHYMNSGIVHVPTVDPVHPDFVPETPGTTDLVAYWSFDNQTGENTAPATRTTADLDLILNPTLADDISPVAGVRGGSGIRVGGAIASDNVLGDITNRRNAFPHIPQESGLNHLFPDVNVSDQWTWIGWMRARQDGANHYGGVAGWFTDAGSDTNTALGIGDWNNQAASTSTVDRGRGVEWSASGISTTFNSGPSPDGGGNLIGVLGGEWQLWAFVFDFRNGIFYSVRDAKHQRIETNRISAISGISKDFIDGAGAFILGSVANANNNQLAEFDDWAIYKRCLSIPEMSGFALSGIETFTPESPLGVSFKQTLGYWTLNSSGLYDPEGVSGIRFNDDSWYRHHLTNLSGLFSPAETLNAFVGDGSLAIASSGAMLSVERIFTGSNLDFSTDQSLSSSGFSAGMWAYVPSGDLATQGYGTSGLDGTRILLGNWSQSSLERSWFLGLEDGLFEARVVSEGLTEHTISSAQAVPFNTPFFIGFDVQPSGVALNGRLWYGIDGETVAVTQIGDATFGGSTDKLNSVGASGFSIFNAPNLNLGFPQTTRGQGAFVYNGAFSPTLWGQVKQAGIAETTLDADAVSTTDPANISHWKFDNVGKRFIDFGKEQNYLVPVNTDGHVGGVFEAVHGSGVIVRVQEYLDTLPFNSTSRRLDLGSGTQSWTFLGWVKPPVISNSDEHTIMAKSASLSGIRVFTPADSLQLTANASGKVCRGENGDLAPGQWNHIAVVFDRDNDEFGTYINGRYAGTTFETLLEVPVNNSGMALGGRGDQNFNALFGGSAFSGQLDDVMLFSRALTLPEVSGLAANSYNYNDGSQIIQASPAFGGYLSGLPLFVISGLIGSFLHGQAQDLELFGGYVSGVSGLCIPYGGWIHGKAQISGAPAIGHFLHGADLASGVFGHFVHGRDFVSGFIGSYEFGACLGLSEFDVVLNFSIFTNEDFDARLGVEKTQFFDFDAKLGVLQITRPPGCTLELPLVGTVASGVPYTLTVQGSGYAYNDKKIAMTRFTFADFKGAESGTLVGGLPNSGLFEASREFDTPGWYTVKIEILDEYGYRSSCCRPFLLLPSGSTSGAFINSLPGISIEATPLSGTAIHTASFTHTISGLTTTSGVLEYTDFADQQESLVNSLEMPVGTQFVDFVRRHDYTMPGRYCPVWAVSGEFGIVSDTIADGIDYLT